MKYIQYALAEKINKQQKVHDTVTWEIIIIFFFFFFFFFFCIIGIVLYIRSLALVVILFNGK